MDKITLGDIATALAFLVTLGGSIVAIVAAVKKAMKALFKEQMEQIGKRLDQQEATIKKIDTENCKNFLVSYLAKAENSDATDEIETQRFWEEYQHYVEIGGNSYIKQKVEKLKAAGKL